MSKKYGLHEFAKLIGRSTSTLRRWDRTFYIKTHNVYTQHRHNLSFSRSQPLVGNAFLDAGQSTIKKAQIMTVQSIIKYIIMILMFVKF